MALAFTPRMATPRDLAVISTPTHWPTWPLLPLIRYQDNGDYLCGVLYDVRGVGGPTGYGATVFLTNVFLLPTTLEDFLALPHETFDTFEELTAAGWVVD